MLYPPSLEVVKPGPEYSRAGGARFALLWAALLLSVLGLGLWVAGSLRAGRTVWEGLADELPVLLREGSIKVAAGDETSAREILARARFARAWLARRWGMDEPSARLRIACAADAGQWTEWVRTLGGRVDGVALLKRRDIYLASPPQAPRYVDVFHELAHWMLREQVGQGLPLWLEEGIAERYGWLIARDYYHEREVALTREQPPWDPSSGLHYEELMALDDYPVEPGRAQAYYRQSAFLAQRIEDRLGPERWPQFLRALGRGGEEWNQLLRRSFRWSEADRQWVLGMFEQAFPIESDGDTGHE